MRIHFTIFLLCSIMSSGKCQKADATFVVKKKSNRPITIGWFDFDSLSTSHVYQIPLKYSVGQFVYDSVLCLNMDCKVYTSEMDGTPYIIFGKDAPGKAYIAFYSQHRQTQEWRQTFMRPVIFKDLSKTSKK